MDEEDKGRFDPGFSFFHSSKDSVGYRFGYMSAFVIGGVSFSVMFSIFQLLPPLETITFNQFLNNKLIIWIAAPLICMLAIADFLGPSGSKLFFNSLLLLITGLMIYIEFSDTNIQFWQLLTFFITIAGICATVGVKWHSIIANQINDFVTKQKIDLSTSKREKIDLILVWYPASTVAYVLGGGIIGVFILHP